MQKHEVTFSYIQEVCNYLSKIFKIIVSNERYKLTPLLKELCNEETFFNTVVFYVCQMGFKKFLIVLYFLHLLFLLMKQKLINQLFHTKNLDLAMV